MLLLGQYDCKSFWGKLQTSFPIGAPLLSLRTEQREIKMNQACIAFFLHRSIDQPPERRPDVHVHTDPVKSYVHVPHELYFVDPYDTNLHPPSSICFGSTH